MELLSTVLTSAVVSACLTGLFTLQSSERKIQIENITQERAKWRERIRSNGLLVHKAAVAHEAASLAELSFVFQLLLNPHDSEDKLIIRCIDDLKSASDLTPKLSEFTSRLSFLLKHDWERAKHEARPFFLRWNEPKRVIYE